ncbi:DinB superfamily protein [Ekhidna lutea]|uniref:DinB superfamily protein n=1 Tax=Ekhidna lutea TaxID=447679 RepID=A0A239LLE4_EKHLU|nr:DinB family protein [Ekhidna lutea]SNT30708.1 DinB superfamily protein [Ekhidna lutea]
MQFNLKKSILILERTPSVLQEILKDLPEDWTTPNEGAETWSPFDVVGHLIHGEQTDWIARTKTILEHGESRPFDPFDRFAQFEKSKGKTINELLDEFERLRVANLKELQSLSISENDLNKTGMHPGLGPVTLRNLLSGWVVHDLGHVAQISRVMAKQYTVEVGPWTEYMSILK